MKIKLFTQDYKGKFDVLTDDSYDEIGGKNEPIEIETKSFDWKNHCLLANYYGVPAYLGTNKKILKIIEKYENELDTEDLY